MNKRGRPKATKKERAKWMVTMTIRVKPETKKALQRKARKRKSTPTELAREAVEASVAT